MSLLKFFCCWCHAQLCLQPSCTVVILWYCQWPDAARGFFEHGFLLLEIVVAAIVLTAVINNLLQVSFRRISWISQISQALTEWFEPSISAVSCLITQMVLCFVRLLYFKIILISGQQYQLANSCYHTALLRLQVQG